MTNIINPSRFVPKVLDTVAFTQLFTDQLGTMHNALSHLSSKLSTLAAMASFKDLQFAVEETVEDTYRQLIRIEAIANIFNITISDENCLGMKAIVQETYLAVGRTEMSSLICDVAMIFICMSSSILRWRLPHFADRCP